MQRQSDNRERQAVEHDAERLRLSTHVTELQESLAKSKLDARRYMEQNTLLAREVSTVLSTFSSYCGISIEEFTHSGDHYVCTGGGDGTPDHTLLSGNNAIAGGPWECPLYSAHSIAQHRTPSHRSFPLSLRLL